MALLPNLSIALSIAALPLEPTAAAALYALLLGVSGSLHCFLMCGPLACAATPLVPLGRRSGVTHAAQRAKSALWAYHGARIASYALVGGLLGLFGHGVSRAFVLPLRAALPWVLIAALIASASSLGKRVAPIPGFAALVRTATRLGTLVSPRSRALVIGAITPLLPCGLLYGLFAAAFTAASFAAGALLLGAFAVGAAPALLAAQLPSGLRGRLRGLPALALEKGVPLGAAAVIAYRALQSARGQTCH